MGQGKRQEMWRAAPERVNRTDTRDAGAAHFGRYASMKRTLSLIPVLSCLAVLAVSAVARAQPTDAASGISSQSGIGYATVEEALAAVKTKPGVQVEIAQPDGWTIVNEPANVQWSFTPSSHPANPAVVRRELKANGGGDLSIQMSALCQAEKAECDKLLEDFKELNERIRQSVRAGMQNGQQR